MKMYRFVIILFVLALVALALQHEACANLLSDPGFELGGSALEIKDGPWTWSGGNNGAAFYESIVQRSGNKSAKTLIWAGTSGDYAYFVEELTGIDYFSPYTVSGYFLHNSIYPLQDGSAARFKLTWQNDFDETIRIDESQVFDNSYSLNTWHLVSLTTSIPPYCATKVEVAVVLDTDRTYSPLSYVYTDDMNFEVIEPTSLILFGSGLVSLLALNRKRKVG